MQAGSVEGALGSRTFPGETFHYAYYEPPEWRMRLTRAGFEVLDANYHESGADHCNPGAHGWIETLAVVRCGNWSGTARPSGRPAPSRSSASRPRCRPSRPRGVERSGPRRAPFPAPPAPPPNGNASCRARVG